VLGLFPSHAQADYQRTIKSIYQRRWDELGFTPRAGAHANDAPDRQKLRQDLVHMMADEAHDPATRKLLNDASTQLLAGQTSALDQAFYRTALRVHVQDGDTATTRNVLSYALASKDQMLRTAAIEAVSTNARVADAQWLFTQFNDERLRSTEKLELMHGLMSEAATRDTAFEWLKNNYDDFAKGAGIFGATLIPTLPGLYCSEDKAQEIDRVLRPKVQRAGRGELAFNRMLENIRTCSALKTAKGAEIAAALR